MAHGGEEAAFRIVDAVGFVAGDLERALLHLALGHIAQHRDHFALGRIRGIGGGIERPAAHFDPGKLAAADSVAVAADAEFDRAVLAERGCIGERGEIGRPVGHMHAVEQAVPGKLADAHAEQRLGRRRNEQHGAVACHAG